MRDIDKLIEDGYEQVSRKYRTVARLPPGKTGLEALREVDPRLADQFLKNANEMAKHQYLRCYDSDKIELTYEEFSEFLIKTGRSPLPLDLIKERAIAKGTYVERKDGDEQSKT